MQSGHFILVRVGPVCFDILHCCLYQCVPGQQDSLSEVMLHPFIWLLVFKSKIQASHRFQFPPAKQGSGSVHISKKSMTVLLFLQNFCWSTSNKRSVTVSLFSAVLLVEHIQQKCDCLILPLTCPVSLSVQFKLIYMCVLKKAHYICAPPHLSEISPMLPLKCFQCSSD